MPANRIASIGKVLGSIMLFSLMGNALNAQAGETRKVIYEIDGKSYEGTVAMPANRSGRAPGVLIIPDWMGPSPYFDSIAEDLAQLGYVAMVADVYGADVRPQNGQEASKAAGELRGGGDRGEFRKRLEASLEVLKKQEGVDADRLGAIGYCFGGTGVLEMVRAGLDLKGVVSLHGGLGTSKPEEAKNIKGAVLVLHGSDDPVSDWNEVSALKKELDDAKVDWKLVIYGGKHHSFTDPKANAAGRAQYDAKAAKDAWKEMTTFLKDELKSKEAE